MVAGHNEKAGTDLENRLSLAAGHDYFSIENRMFLTR